MKNLPYAFHISQNKVTATYLEKKWFHRLNKGSISCGFNGNQLICYLHTCTGTRFTHTHKYTPVKQSCLALALSSALTMPERTENLHGWSPKWLIASLVCTLQSQLKITCHLFSGFSPPVPTRVSHAVFYRDVGLRAYVIAHTCVCVCVCVCGHGVSATGDPYMAVSTRWRGGFVLSVFPRGSIRLCCVSDGNQRLRRGSQKSHFTPLNAKLLLSLHHTVKAPSNTFPEFSIPSVFFFPRAH